MNNEMFNEELIRLIRRMLDNIVYGGDKVEEINFCINRIEELAGREFTPEETVTWFDALKNIVNKAIKSDI